MLKKETRAVMNVATKEEEGDLAVLVKQIAHLRDTWMFMHRKGFLRLAKEGLKGRDFDVLMVYLGLLDFSNQARLTQREVAEYLGIPQQSVARSTKKLIEKNILVEGERIGRNKTYLLNTFFGWKGVIGEKYYKSYEDHSRLFDELG